MNDEDLQERRSERAGFKGVQYVNPSLSRMKRTGWAGIAKSLHFSATSSYFDNNNIIASRFCYTQIIVALSAKFQSGRN